MKHKNKDLPSSDKHFCILDLEGLFVGGFMFGLLCECYSTLCTLDLERCLCFIFSSIDTTTKYYEAR